MTNEQLAYIAEATGYPHDRLVAFLIRQGHVDTIAHLIEFARLENISRPDVVLAILKSTSITLANLVAIRDNEPEDVIEAMAKSFETMFRWVYMECYDI